MAGGPRCVSVEDSLFTGTAARANLAVASFCSLPCRWPSIGPNSCPATGFNGTIAPVCSNLTSDVNNCGSCGKSCGSAEGATCCRGNCTNSLTDENNCGGCGIKCSGTDICSYGYCIACTTNSTYVYGIADNQLIYEVGRTSTRKAAVRMDEPRPQTRNPPMEA
jgi:hypothetical protein